MSLKMFKLHFLLTIFSLNFFVRFINPVGVEEGQNEKEGSMRADSPLCESGLPSNCPPLAVIVDRNYVKLARPILRNNELFFKKQKSEKLICACPEKITTENELLDNQTLIPDTNQSDREKCPLNCQKDIVPFHRFDNSRCGEKDGKIIEIGYEKTYFLRLLTICYQFSNRRIVFIRHKIRSFDFFPYAEPRPALITYQKIYDNIEVVYREENQKQVFEQTFPENHKEYFVGPHDEIESEKDQKYFVMRQLVDDKDMVLTNWKKSTYFFANTVPVWNTIEYLLDLVNDQIRDLAVKLEEEVIIYSGTHGYLKKSKKWITLADQNGDMKLSVPALIWKVIFLKKCTMGLAVIIHNDISPPEKDFCRKISDEEMAKIISNNFNTSLYHYFCHLDENLKAKIQLKNLDTVDEINIIQLITDEEFKNRICVDEDSDETNEEFYVDEKMEDEFEMSEDDESSEKNDDDDKETENYESKQADNADSSETQNEESADKPTTSSSGNLIANPF